MKVTNRELWNACSLWGDPAKAGAKDPGPQRARGKPEQGVLNSVLSLLRVHRKVAWAQRMNSGAYKTPDGRFIRFGFPGCPDIIGQMRDGRILMIECKSDDGRVTEDQRAVLAKVRQHGGCAGVARNVDDALAIVGPM